MFRNPEVFNDTYQCGKYIANYLIYRCHLPLLGMKDGIYYFSKTKEWEDATKNINHILKIMDKISRL